MARKKNGAFAGANLGDCDPTSPTFRRTVENLAGDQALIYDRITGTNGASSDNWHDGNTRGAPLGVPLVNQYIQRSISWTNAGTGAKDAGIDEINLCAAPIFITGDATTSDSRDLVVELFATFDTINPDELNAHVVITEAAFGGTQTERVRVPMVIDTQRMPSGASRLFANLTSSGLDSRPRGYFIVWVRITPTQDPPQATAGTVAVGTLHSWSVRYSRLRIPSPPSRRNATDGSACNVPTPSSTQGLAFKDFDTTNFADRQSVNAYLLSKLDRNANALLEYLTGWPAGGNYAYTHVDHDGAGAADETNPARSRFFAHTRSLYANEPEMDFPIISEAFGAFRTDGYYVTTPGAATPDGMLDWFAPYPTAATLQVVREVPLVWPDLLNSLSGKLQIRVLLGSATATVAAVANWQLSVIVGGSTITLGAPTALDATNIYWMAEAQSTLALPSDSVDVVQLRLTRTTAFGSARDICLLGWAIYYVGS